MEEQIEKFVKEYLGQELIEFKKNISNEYCSELSDYEKVLIYKYTEDGYEGLNEKLRISKGLSVPKYGRYLSYVLKKLPNYAGLVYRGINLTKSQLLAYKEAKNKNKPIVEPTFVSTSKSKLIAGMFGNTLFTILSKRGKSIEELSKYGPSQNEKEVLFNYNSKCMSYYNSLIFR